MARGGAITNTAADLTPSLDHIHNLQQQEQQLRASEAEEAMSPEQYEAEDTSVEEQMEEEVETEEEEEDGEEEEEHEDGVPLADPAAAGLKEISNLGKFTVSSHKQGNGVEELRSDDTKAYWQ
jgi:anaphase-promoting complex subunit 10